jgi:hypothetical protein
MLGAPNLTEALVEKLYTLPYPKDYSFHTFFINHYPNDIERYGVIYSSSGVPEFLLLLELFPKAPDLSGLGRKKLGEIEVYEGYTTKFPLIELTWPGRPKSTLTCIAKQGVMTLAGIGSPESTADFLEQLLAAEAAGRLDELVRLFSGFALLPRNLNGISPITAFFGYLNQTDDSGSMHMISSARANFLLGKDFVSIELRRGCEHEECLPGLLPDLAGAKNTRLDGEQEIIRATTDAGSYVYHYSPEKRFSAISSCPAASSRDFSAEMRQLVRSALANLDRQASQQPKSDS